MTVLSRMTIPMGARAPIPKPERRMPALLYLDRITKRYLRGEAELLVLDQVELEIAPCDFVAVRGRRSSGKTTLLRIAAGTELPDSGQVLFQGRDINQISGGARADLLNGDIAFVQRTGPSTQGLTMLDYVALPLFEGLSKVDAHYRAEVALHRVGADDCASLTWDMVSEGARTLVSIAHALVRSPKLVLADDPVAGLGAVESSVVLGLLSDLAKEGGVGILMVSPELPEVRPKPRVMSLSHGRLIGPRAPVGDVIDLDAKRRPDTGQ